MPKSDQEKAEIRRQTEAHRQPDSDRNEHEAKRGRNKKRKSGQPPARAALPRLSRDELNDDEFEYAIDIMRKGSDCEAAIIGQALLEEALTAAINAKLVRSDERNELYHKQGAPFGSFKAKTVAAYALGFGDASVMEDLDRIREIRNQFSHALRYISFETESISTVCSELGNYEIPGNPGFFSHSIKGAKARYTTTCECIWVKLSREISKVLNDKASMLERELVEAQRVNHLMNQSPLNSLLGIKDAKPTGGEGGK